MFRLYVSVVACLPVFILLFIKKKTSCTFMHFQQQEAECIADHHFLELVNWFSYSKAFDCDPVFRYLVIMFWLIHLRLYTAWCIGVKLEMLLGLHSNNHNSLILISGLIRRDLIPLKIKISKILLTLRFLLMNFSYSLLGLPLLISFGLNII